MRNLQLAKCYFQPVKVKLRLDPATLGPHGYVESVHPWFNHAGNVYHPQLRAPVRGEYHEVWCRLRMRATVLVRFLR